MKKGNKNELFNFGKGWGTIIFCLLMFWFYAGMVNDSSNVVAPAVAEKLGIPAGNVLNMGTVAAMVGVIFFFVMGAVNRKIGPRVTSFICLILGGVGYFGMGHANSLAQYAIALCICTIGCMSAGYISGGAFVAQWFPKKKGIVMGYTTMGHNMSTGFFVPLITMLVARMGVTNAVVFPVILIVILAFVGLVFMRNTPQERGINPDNVSDEEYRNEYFNEEIDEDGGWTVKKLFSKKTFWLVAVASGGFQFVSTIIITQLVVRNQEVGFTQAQALTIDNPCLRRYRRFLDHRCYGSETRHKENHDFLWYLVCSCPASGSHRKTSAGHRFPDHVRTGSGRFRKLYDFPACSCIRTSWIQKSKLCTFPDSGTGIFLRLLCKWKCIKRNRKPANVLCHCSHCFYRCRYHCTFHQ